MSIPDSTCSILISGRSVTVRVIPWCSRGLNQQPARKWPTMPCVRQNASHHSALFSAATRISRRRDTPAFSRGTLAWRRSAGALAGVKVESLRAAVPWSSGVSDGGIPNRPQRGWSTRGAAQELDGLTRPEVAPSSPRRCPFCSEASVGRRGRDQAINDAPLSRQEQSSSPNTSSRPGATLAGDVHWRRGQEVAR